MCQTGEGQWEAGGGRVKSCSNVNALFYLVLCCMHHHIKRVSLVQEKRTILFAFHCVSLCVFSFVCRLFASCVLSLVGSFSVSLGALLLPIDGQPLQLLCLHPLHD